MGPHDGDDPLAPLDELGRGFRKRTWKTARLLARLGRRAAARGIGFTSTTRDADKAVRQAERLLAELDGLKGLAMKLGQMISYLDGTLPPQAQQVLARLQATSRPMAPEQIAAVVADELGAPPEELFDAFDPTPFAAASIGQVHRGRVGSVDVAIKVQYPGIEDLLRGDLTTVGRLSRVAMALSPVDGGGMARELASRVIEECDYDAEADNQERFRLDLASTPGVRVPRVIRTLSTRRVLTSELAPGRSFYDFCDTAAREAKDRAGAALFGTSMRSIFHRCAYNADPHPGNYLFDDDGGLTLLDFGCVKRFDPAFIVGWKRLARAIIDGDRAGFPDAFRGVGFVSRERGFDYEHQWEAMRVLYRPMLEPGFRFDHDYVREMSDRIMFQNKNKWKLTVPPEWLFVNRLQWGLYSVLAHLGAAADWPALFRDALDAPIEPMFHAAYDDDGSAHETPTEACSAETSAHSSSSNADDQPSASASQSDR